MGWSKKYQEKVKLREVECKNCGAMIASRMKIVRCYKCGTYTDPKKS